MNQWSENKNHCENTDQRLLDRSLCDILLGKYFETIALLKLDKKGTSNDASYSCELVEECFVSSQKCVGTKKLLLTGEHPNFALLENEQLILPDSHLNGFYKYLFPLDNKLTLLAFSKSEKELSHSTLEMINLIFMTHYKNYNLTEKINNLECVKGNERDDEPKNEVISSSTVLLAEDNIANQILMTQQLEILGYSIDVAENGEEAYRLWKQGNYKIILTDCNMPVMDGFELTAKIREEEAKSGGHIPIIAVTANAMKGEAENCLKLGMDDYLPKPIRLKSMSEVLERWLSQSESVSELNEFSQSERLDVVTSNIAHNESRTTKVETATPIDCDLLIELLGEDKDIQRAFVNSFLISTPPILDSIVTSCKLQSTEHLGFAIHKIKSSVKAVGAVDMEKVVKDIDGDLHKGDWTKLDRKSVV